MKKLAILAVVFSGVFFTSCEKSEISYEDGNEFEEQRQYIDKDEIETASDTK